MSKWIRGQRPIRRVVVTGMGVISPLGNNLDETWSNALAGKSGISRISKFNTDAFAVKIAGEVKSFDVDRYVDRKEQKRMDTFIHYSIACAKMAVDHAQLPMTDEVKNQTGVIVGVGIGGLPVLEEQLGKLKDKGPGRLSPFFIPSVLTNLAAGQISIGMGFRGLNYSVTSACATGAHSIGEAYRYIQDGLTDVMLAGGAESTVSPAGIGGFEAMKALSTRNDEPEKASRPFDKGRDGFVLAEGAAVFVLESLEHAEKRGARILAEVTGYGASSDAYHMTSPAPEGRGAAQAMRRALMDAGLDSSAIGYVNAHGTSTPLGDELETLAIKSIMGEHAKKVLVSSTKSMTGHTLGAAGALESAFCVLALRDQIVPPTINLENPSEGCDLDYVTSGARKATLQHTMNNSFGFGGTNACLIFSKI